MKQAVARGSGRSDAGRAQSWAAALGFHIVVIAALGALVGKSSLDRRAMWSSATPRHERISGLNLAVPAIESQVTPPAMVSRKARLAESDPGKLPPVSAAMNAANAQVVSAEVNAARPSLTSADPNPIGASRDVRSHGTASAESVGAESGGVPGSLNEHRLPGSLRTNPLGELHDRRLYLPVESFAKRRTVMDQLDSALEAGVGATMDSMNAAAALEVERATMKTMLTTRSGTRFGLDAGGLRLGRFSIGMQMAPSTTVGGSAAQRASIARADIDRMARLSLGDAAFRTALPNRMSGPVQRPPRR